MAAAAAMSHEDSAGGSSRGTGASLMRAHPATPGEAGGLALTLGRWRDHLEAGLRNRLLRDLDQVLR